MPVNDLIKTNDYNNIRGTILAVYGPGSGNKGYGQTMASAYKADHDRVSQTDWDNLRFDIVNAITHQSGTAPVIADVEEGQLISFTNNTTYTTLASTADTNRFNIGSGRFITQATAPNGSVTRTWSGATIPQYWLNEITCEITLTFSTADEARWFFNSGGEIRIQTSRTGGTNNAQNNDWSSLLSAAGQRSFGSQTPITGFSPMNGQNFYRLTNSYQNYYTLSSSAPYASNSYRLQAKCNVANNSTGTANIINLRVVMTDAYVDPGNLPTDIPNTAEGVDGTFTVTVVERKASGPLIPSGTFTIVSPSVTIGAITGS
jgi:hypothetical protein